MTKLIMDACCNHLGNYEIIQHMIFLASKNANYIKFQLYNSDELNKNWDNFQDARGKYVSYEIPYTWIEAIASECKKNNIKLMFTIFSKSRIEYIRNIECAIKIASPDMSNYSLVDDIIRAYPDREIFISTGMHTEEEIKACRERYTQAKFLYCISKYPTPKSEVNFDKMLTYAGFSDHTLGISVTKKAINKGIRYIEKHFTLSRYLPGKDHRVSVTPPELKSLSEHITNIRNSKNYKKRWVNEA